MNTLYADLLRARIAGALAEASALRELSHAGLKGELREVLVARLLLPLVPPNVGVTSGVIITANNEQSPQTDVIVYDKVLLPPFLVAEKGLVPIEAVLFAIEVKSTLTREELQKAHDAAQKLLSFDLLPGHEAAPGEQYTFRSPISAVFAFASDLTEGGMSEIERYQDLLGASNPAVMKMCVVGRGSWRRIRSEWSPWPRRGTHDEVLGFLASIMNTLSSLSESRGSPRMGHYVSE